MLRSALAAFAAFAAGPSLAQTSAWTLEGTIGVVSDYRYRGYSLSDEQPALQAGATLSHRSGVYADVYLSSIDEYGVGDDGDGADVEVTGSIGWGGDLGGFMVDAAIAAYRYPDGDGVNYVEFPVQLSRAFDALTGTVGLAYAPSQSALSDEDNTYGWAALDYGPENWPVALTGRLGYEDGAFAPDGKIDWELSVTRDLGPAVLGLAWTDSDDTDGALVASVFFNF